MVLILSTHETEIEKFQSGFSGMPRVSQNHDGPTKLRLQPILLLENRVLGVAKCVIMFASAGVYLLAMSSPVLQAFLEFLSIGNCGLCGSE